ncbi:MAG: Crp/Fnr family transcriptional regulator [Dehalococcoidia bacterium]|nr:Crp/Fnr family transcriptional regulator [Dehalococcoidia bacterium]
MQATPGEDRIVSALRKCALVSGLSEAEVTEVATRASIHKVRANRRLFEEGEECKGLWIVTAGRVRLLHLMADGRRHAVGFHAPTTPLDLGAALDGQPYMTTAMTLIDSEFILIPRPVLIDLGRDYPVTIRNAIDLLCIEVRQRDITAAVAALKDARGRIGCSLLQLARQFGTTDGSAISINYPLTRQHIADRSGVTVETAIRVMSEMQQNGVIQTDNQIIQILDLPRISDAVSCDGCQFECSVFAQKTAVRLR